MHINTSMHIDSINDVKLIEIGKSALTDARWIDFGYGEMAIFFEDKETLRYFVETLTQLLDGEGESQ